MTTKTMSRRLDKLEQAIKARVLPTSIISPDNGNSDQSLDVTHNCDVANGAGRETNRHELPTGLVSDARPDPKPRKHPHLWQAYLWWYELMEMRKRHLLRISSIERGKSDLDAQFEKDMLDASQLDALLKLTKKNMTLAGVVVGPIWEWVTSIKGLGEGGLAAQLIAQIDDIKKFDTVASLWRFAGYAVIEGKAEKNQKGEKSKFNRKLKGVCYNIADQFIRQQTPGYVDIYYAEKEKQRLLNPDVLCKQCGIKWEDCQSKKAHVKIFTDGHIHNRAWRKMIKCFLRDVWVEWRKQQ